MKTIYLLIAVALFAGCNAEKQPVETKPDPTIAINQRITEIEKRLAGYATQSQVRDEIKKEIDRLDREFIAEIEKLDAEEPENPVPQPTDRLLSQKEKDRIETIKSQLLKEGVWSIRAGDRDFILAEPVFSAIARDLGVAIKKNEPSDSVMAKKVIEHGLTEAEAFDLFSYSNHDRNVVVLCLNQIKLEGNVRDSYKKRARMYRMVVSRMPKD